MSRIVRTLLADDEATVREALSDFVSAAPGFELVGAAASAHEVIELASKLQPDVVLVDVKMPGGGGAHAAREIRRLCPRTKVVALSAYEDQATVREMLRAGACGYLVKGNAPEEILRAIRTAVDGEGALSGSVAAVVIEDLAEQLEREEAGAQELRERTAKVRSALAPGGLGIVLQPVIEIDSGWVAGFEALTRIPHGPPDRCFADARQVGLLEELELAAASAALDRFDDLPHGCSLAINVSPETVTGDRFLRALEHMPFERIVIEITEHAAVDDYDQLNDSLTAFRAGGGRLAVDDAGAGFASLRHILLMDPDVIKLDISLTRGIHEHRKRRALAVALVSFAREFGADVVAEGVESVEELDTLMELGARFVQGYLLSRPIGPDLPLPKRIDIDAIRRAAATTHEEVKA